MTDFELKSVLHMNYRYLLSLARTVKMTNPDEYHVIADMLTDYRDFVKGSAHLDDLPEVPR